MRTIAILNQKGGCGKTTTAINLAATLAGKGYRTLLLDMDPQSHCALGLSVPEERIERGTAELLQAGLDGTVGIPDLAWQVSRNLDLVPSTMALATMEQRLAQQPDKDRRLSQVLATVQDRYDVCILDCPPSIGLLTFNALRACDEVLIPVETGYFALQGSVRQARTIEMLIQRVGHRVRFSVLPTMYDVRTKLAREILGELKRHFGKQVLPCVINFNAKLKEAASFGQPITEYDPSCRGMQDFEELTTWLLKNPPAAPEVIQPAYPHPQAQPLAQSQIDASPPAGHANQTSDAYAPAPQPGNAFAHADADVDALTNDQTVTPPPPMSRAAELAGRARELSSRTAQLSARLDRTAGPTLADPRQAPTAQTEPKQAKPESPLEPVAAPTRPTRAAEPNAQNLRGVRVVQQGTLFVQTFDDPALGQPSNLALAGDFNDWNPSKTPLIRNEALGVWQAVLPLPPGKYRYRLVVDGQWVQDPHNPHTETNPFGELNNVVDVQLQPQRQTPPSPATQIKPLHQTPQRQTVG